MLVMVEDALNDIAVVSVKVGGRTWRGVLLETETRLIRQFKVF